MVGGIASLSHGVCRPEAPKMGGLGRQELDAQLSVSPRWRRWVVWWNRLVAAVGGGLGLGVGIAMVMGEP